MGWDRTETDGTEGWDGMGWVGMGWDGMVEGNSFVFIHFKLKFGSYFWFGASFSVINGFIIKFGHFRAVYCQPVAIFDLLLE